MTKNTSYRTTGPLKMGWGGDGDRLLSAISSSSSRLSARTQVFRLRSMSTELMTNFSWEPGPGKMMLPGCLVTTNRAVVSGTVVVTGGAQRTTVDAAAVTGFGGTTGLWILQRSCSASGAVRVLYANFEDCPQLACICETTVCMSASGTGDPTGIMATYFNESSANKTPPHS